MRQQFEAAHHRHIDVEQEQIDRFILHRCQL